MQDRKISPLARSFKERKERRKMTKGNHGRRIELSTVIKGQELNVAYYRETERKISLLAQISGTGSRMFNDIRALLGTLQTRSIR